MRRILVITIIYYLVSSIFNPGSVNAQTPPYDYTDFIQLVTNFSQHTIFDFNALINNILNPPPTPTLTPVPPPPTITLTPVPSGQYTFTDGSGGNVFTSQDNMLHSGAPTINFGGHDVYDVSIIRNFIQRFNLSSISKSATIQSARVYYYKASAVPNRSLTVTAYSISQANGDWLEGAQYGGTAVGSDSSWNLKRASGTAWAGSAGLSTSGIDFEPTPLCTFNIPASAPVGREFICNLTLSRVQGWLGTPNTNYGILMVASDMAEYIGSSEHANPTLRPKLVVQYGL